MLQCHQDFLLLDVAPQTWISSFFYLKFVKFRAAEFVQKKEPIAENEDPVKIKK